MRNKKIFIMVGILLMAIGFATVSTILYINGSATVSTNLEDWDVFFTSAKTDIGGSAVIESDKKNISWITKELMKPGDRSVLSYTVKNNSSMYDADVTISATNPNTEYFDITITPTTMAIGKGKISKGEVIVELKKLLEVPFEEDPVVNIELDVNAIESNERVLKEVYTLKGNNDFPIKSSDTTYLRNQIKEITILDSLNVPEDALESYNIDSEDLGTIKAYITNNSESGYDMFIASNGSIKAPEDFSNWFSGYYSASTINNLELLDTSDVTNMREAFSGFGYSANSVELNLTSLNVSKVTDMYGILQNCGAMSPSINIDIRNWDTSSVENASYMFAYLAQNRPSELDFKISNNMNFKSATTMDHMFYNFGMNTTNEINLDLSNFQLEKVTTIEYIFDSLLKNNKNVSFDVSNWNTSSVENMYRIFSTSFCKAENFTLDLSSWDVSNVTNFSFGYNLFQDARNVNVDISGWSFDSLESIDYHGLFDKMGLHGSGNYVINMSNLKMPKIKSISTLIDGLGNGSNSKMISIQIDAKNFDAPLLNDGSKLFYNVGSYASPSISIDLRGWNVPSLTVLNNAFFGIGNHSNKDVSIYLPTIDFTQVTNSSNVFKYCSDRAKIYVKDENNQNWILNLSSDSKPSVWTSDNIIIYTE